MRLLLAMLLTIAAFGKASAAIDARPDPVEFRDIPKTHWAYEVMNRIYCFPEFEKLSPHYDEGVRFGSNEMTRYEVALVLVKIEAEKSRLQKVHHVFSSPDSISILEIDDGLAALEMAVQPEFDALQQNMKASGTR